jgi:hypothetical protein
MAELSYTISRFIAWWVDGLDNLLIKYWPAYCVRRYCQAWDNYRVAGDHIWNKNLLEVLNVQYGYDDPATIVKAKGE